MTARQFLRIVIASASRPVQNMFKQVDIGAGGDRLRQICGNQFASGGRIFLGEASFGCIDAGCTRAFAAWLHLLYCATAVRGL
jgi:hypothetical protein